MIGRKDNQAGDVAKNPTFVSLSKKLFQNGIGRKDNSGCRYSKNPT